MREREVAQSCPTLSDPMDCSLPGTSVHGIFQARVLEWGAIAFSKFVPTDPSSLYCPSSSLPTPSSVLNWTHSGYIYIPMWGTWETLDGKFHSPAKTIGSTWISLSYEIPGIMGTTPRAPSRKEGKKGRESPRRELGSNRHERPSPEAGGLRAVLLDKKWRSSQFLSHRGKC